MGTNGSTMLEPLRQGLPPLDPSAVSSTASVALAARYEAVGSARKFTRTTLTQWDLDERFDDIALVVSELVTNALRHGLPLAHHRPSNEALRAAPFDSADTPRESQDPPVRLHLMRWASRLVCAVRDPSDESPVTRDTDDDFSAESGRGLFLVDSFSDGWGWHPLAGTLRGKVVWALFHLA
ncbi:ATP-binding protein [Streptomyces kanamyceticus]|uniref:ATP-binding protein n=1 Tax=Streptomyces kanamyceticus TaxID=1967 RepID=A0A5J6GCY5_STRKN|nr:ATP-binding protein [Streptomyces kanamyceticus]QEU92767.1 ATP-binding protein [Streptomyces kanamyceticus]